MMSQVSAKFSLNLKQRLLCFSLLTLLTIADEEEEIDDMMTTLGKAGGADNLH